MKVKEKNVKKLEAIQFTNDSKFSLANSLNFYCRVELIKDPEEEPILVFADGKIAHIGDWIVVNEADDKIYDICNEKEFNERYYNLETPTPKTLDAWSDIVPCSSNAKY